MGRERAEGMTFSKEERFEDACCAGAELANVANEGALECGRRGGDVITTADIYNGIDRILQVLPPPSNSLSELHAS